MINFEQTKTRIHRTGQCDPCTYICLMAKAIGRLFRGLSERLWLRPLLQIHAELMFELPEERLSEAVEFVKKCMEIKPFKDFYVPLVAEATVGKRFGSLKEMEG